MNLKKKIQINRYNLDFIFIQYFDSNFSLIPSFHAVSQLKWLDVGWHHVWVQFQFFNFAVANAWDFWLKIYGIWYRNIAVVIYDISATENPMDLRPKNFIHSRMQSQNTEIELKYIMLINKIFQTLSNLRPRSSYFSTGAHVFSEFRCMVPQLRILSIALWCHPRVVPSVHFFHNLKSGKFWSRFSNKQ